MPHVLVSVVAGHPLAARQALAERIVVAVTETLGSEVDEVSVAIREVSANDWMAPEELAQAEADQKARQHQFHAALVAAE